LLPSLTLYNIAQWILTVTPTHFHVQANFLAHGIEKHALLALTSWGMELFRSSIADAAMLDMTLSDEGTCAFREKNKQDVVLLALDQNATTCCCRFWTAYHLQCSHLLLLHKGFCVKLCSRRWLQVSCLETSGGDHEEQFDSSVVSSDHVDTGLGGVAAAIASRNATLASTRPRNIGFSDILHVATDFAQAVANLSSNNKKLQYFGGIIKLTEMVKGNVESTGGVAVDDLLCGHFCMYDRSFAGKHGLPQNAKQSENVVGPDNQMKLGAPTPAYNHGKKRLKSWQEEKNDLKRRMMDSSYKKRCCSLCCNVGHIAKGSKCPIAVKYRAHLVGWNETHEIASRIGDPECFEVHRPDEHTRQHIHEWFCRGGSNDALSMLLPADAFHLVLQKSYYCAVANLHFRHNLIEVTVLKERGVELPGWEKAYFPAYQIRVWLEKNCSANQRKRHCLSALKKKTANHQLYQDNMYNYNIGC
jgi:hypothetical protein